MMKKWVLCLVFAALSTSAFAQRQIKTAAKAGVQRANLMRKVSSQMQRSGFHLPLAQLVNLPGNPAFKIQIPADVNYMPNKILPVKLLAPSQMRNIILSEKGMYVPDVSNSKNFLLYRGMQLHSMAEIENLMSVGLEKSRSNYAGKIHMTPALNIALGYTFPSRRGSVAEEGKKNIPVLVTVPYTAELVNETSFYEDGFQYVFESDIPARQVGEVMVFWSVEGKTGWYKVILEGKELVFVPVPSKLLQLPLVD